MAATIMPSRGQAKTRRSGAPALALLLALGLAACTGGTQTEAQRAVAKAHVCSSCHGLDGKSLSSNFPRLAGQQKEYLVNQLKAFRDHSRADPHATTYMWGMAASLTDADIDALADYYSKQSPAMGSPGDSKEVAAGRTIFEMGIESENVPACKTCHGDQAEGSGEIPRLAGQHRSYLERQLQAFAENARANEIMHQNSMNLTAQQISDVAAYLASVTEPAQAQK